MGSMARTQFGGGGLARGLVSHSRCPYWEPARWLRVHPVLDSMARQTRARHEGVAGFPTSCTAAPISPKSLPAALPLIVRLGDSRVTIQQRFGFRCNLGSYRNLDGRVLRYTVQHPAGSDGNGQVSGLRAAPLLEGMPVDYCSSPRCRAPKVAEISLECGGGAESAIFFSAAFFPGREW